ncbi:MAG: serine--tRNA ligase [Bdellovibrionales bacterium GWC1_52_8]|nr:MAG: serine--tRNA ligase [Bdellovibrionales bacterium GWB1_52_6]OFZ04463.1 MAG: serine--tRNA ligase [Bdellovibrionales bacterium GWA1_52_35]OFZ38391.1 MAG: serine--tRNA ligase [Bdellovibrionales bacterium GWC1_52_8]HCM40674.1 serine--tRNA ligase [Bdellovibrionales bacterium]
MLDPIYFQDKIGDLEQALKRRNADPEFIAGLSALAQKRRNFIQETEKLKAQRNVTTQEIAQLKSKAKADPAASAEADKKVLAMRALGDTIKNLDEELKKTEEELSDLALRIPNMPDKSVPDGKDGNDNQEVRRWGEPAKFAFEPKDHVALGEQLEILDFERAGKISGARFVLYLGAGAALERALIQFMLDLHTRQHGYREVIPPFMVNRASMTGTGQLPKFEEDLFKTQLADRELFLIPTSEVPLTNIYRGEILEPGRLPIYLTAYSPCFRSEAGSYGKDTRGLIRQHQFQKVEMVKICAPEQSFEELESMTQNAEKVLQLLEIPYRVVALCAGDMGFGAVKTYDIEVWLPGQNAYREISSCSNCGDFQARRAGIRFKKEAQGKAQLAHTLNGSGLAVGRTFVAVLENYQDPEGNIRIPKVLHRYLDGAPGFTREGESLILKAKK